MRMCGFRVVFLTAMASAVALGVGCSAGSRPTADAAGAARGALPAPIPSSEWPARSQVRLDRALTELSGLPEILTVPIPQRTLVDGKAATETIQWPVMRLSRGGIYGQGLVFRLERISGTRSDSMADAPGFSLKVVTYPPTNEERRRRATATASLPQPVTDAQPPTGTPPPKAAPPRQAEPDRYFGIRPDAWALINRGLWLRLYLPAGSRSEEHPLPLRGLVIHLCSYGGAQFEQPVIEELLLKNWAVLRVASPNLSAQRGSPTYRIDDDDDLDRAARRIARQIDDRLAEHAYAVEAAIAFLADRVPHVPTHPAVLMGYSAGALVTPVIAARMPERFAAAVLVCGGANLLDISQRSELTDGGIKIKWGPGRGTDADLARLKGLYLGYSRLDPFHTAPYLNTTPVLQVHGTMDGIVPADTGDLLFERLNRPDRLVYPIGHKGFFWLLPSQAKRLVDWVEEAVPLPGALEMLRGGLSAATPRAPHHVVP